MEIKVNALELSKRLEQVAKVVANKNVMQILADVMIEIRSGIMILTASDSEIWLSLKCPIVSSEQDVKFCVNAKDLLELTKNLLFSLVVCYFFFPRARRSPAISEFEPRFTLDFL